jgi:ribose 5-phosphate isomerase B
MNIALGTDHAGFALKATISAAIMEAGHVMVDCGAATMQPKDDYPVFAERVALAVQSGKADRGVVLCGSGVGASVAANKVRGIRAALCHDTFSAHQGVEDDDMNVLCIGARVVGPSLAAELVTTFLGAVFSGAERHQRRVDMVKAIEEKAAR